MTKFYSNLSQVFLGSLLVAIGLTELACTYEPASRPFAQEAELNDMHWIAKTPRRWLHNSPLRGAAYPISTSSRLLMHYSPSEDTMSGVETDQGAAIVRIELVDAAEKEMAREDLKICPLRREWSPSASWTKAHAFQNGRWEQAGGDIDWSACVKAIVFDEQGQPVTPRWQPELRGDRSGASWVSTSQRSVAGPPDTVSQMNFYRACHEAPGALCFDVSGWVKDFVGSDKNNGLVVLGEGPSSYWIYNDMSPYGPQSHRLDTALVQIEELRFGPSHDSQEEQTPVQIR